MQALTWFDSGFDSDVGQATNHMQRQRVDQSLVSLEPEYDILGRGAGEVQTLATIINRVVSVIKNRKAMPWSRSHAHSSADNLLGATDRGSKRVVGRQKLDLTRSARLRPSFDNVMTGCDGRSDGHSSS